jgi:hypothetical protein
MGSELIHKVFSAEETSFNRLALDVYRFQYEHNQLYRQFADAIKRSPAKVLKYQQIPFLPIHFFKTHAVKTTAFEPELIFESSGTTGTVNSKHYLKHAEVYERSFLATFRRFYGKPEDWCIIGLLPSYLERKNSSLVKMVNELIRLSGKDESGFYLYEHDRLQAVLEKQESSGTKTLLIGVTFALIDFAESVKLDLRHTIVMETGGMKGRKEEITRAAVHEILKEKLGVATVHSEYGMTELLSQAYAKAGGLFQTPPWMKVLIREEDDPLLVRSKDDIKQQAAGVINVIDLANIYSCAFIATDDAGKLYEDGSFEVTGRMDASDIRGCSLMAL